MSLSLDEFTKRHTSCGLMSVDEFASFQSELPEPPKTVDDLSRRLLEDERLTHFQIGVLQSEDVLPLVLGHYELRDAIGAGGMGQVYLARHRRMKRDVALKVLRSTIKQQPQAILRFEREVEAVAQLSHPNIVVAYDAGDEQGIYFYVMEYATGRNLASIVKHSSPVDVADAIDWTMQAARGLEYAHSKGVIHRDIKPSNLLLDNDGVVKVLDLGLARIDEADAEPAQDGLTSTGTVMGTADFMAPEQALNAKNADHRSDIYSLGCSLFYLLAGHAIYRGESVIEKILAHRDQPIPSLATLRTDVPQSLDAVFARMVAKQPDERYQSMTDVIAALNSCGLAGKAREAEEGASSTTVAATQVAALGSTDRVAPTATYVDADDEAVESQETQVATIEQPTVIADDESLGTTVIRKRRRTAVIGGLVTIAILIGLAVALWLPRTPDNEPIEPAADSTVAITPAAAIHEDVPGLLMTTKVHPQHGSWNVITTRGRGLLRGWTIKPDDTLIAAQCGRMLYLFDSQSLQTAGMILNRPEIVNFRHWQLPGEDSWPSDSEEWSTVDSLLRSPKYISVIDQAVSEGLLRVISPNREKIARSRQDGTIELISSDDSRPMLLAGHPSGVSSLSWSPTQYLLASVGQNGDVGFWPIGEGTESIVPTGFA